MFNRRTFFANTAASMLAATVPSIASAWIPILTPVPSTHASQVSKLPWRIEANAAMQTVSLYDYRSGQEAAVAAWRAAVPPAHQLPEKMIHGRVQSIVPWPTWTPTASMVAKGYAPGTIAGGQTNNPMGNCKIVVGGHFGARHLHAFLSGTRSVYSEGCFSIENDHMLELLGHLGGDLKRPPQEALRQGIELIFTQGQFV